MTSVKRLRRLVAVACSAIFIIVGALANAQSAPESYRLDIPVQPLDTALEALALASNHKLLYPSSLVTGKISPAIKGEYTIDQAVRKLLSGTTLTFDVTPTSVVLIRDRSDKPTLTPAVTTSPGAKPTADASSDNAATDVGNPSHLAQAPGQTSGQGSKLSDGNEGKMESLSEVVVTAQKRSERLIDVPSSLTALSDKSLQTQGVSDFSDYMTLVPSLADFSGGAAGHGAVILRGLNTGYYQTSNTVGYYIDDTPFSATSPLSVGALLTPDPDLIDIDHLEVLKGPQATLYGASTLGGLIKTVTKRPNLNDYTGEVDLDGASVGHGSAGYGVAGIANLPLITGQLALRLSGFDRDSPGYMTNIALGTTARGVTRKQGGRIALRWAPADGLDMQLNVFLQSLRVNGWNFEDVDLRSLTPITGPYTYSGAFEPSFHTTYEVYNFTLSYVAGSLGTLTNSTSYAKYRDQEAQDVSRYYGVFNQYAPVSPPANAAQALFFGPQMNKFSEELRFAAQRVGPLEWLGGLFFTREQLNYLVKISNVIPSTLTPIPGPASLIEGVSTPAVYKEEAAFANLTYHFTDALDLTVGGRFSANQQTLTSHFDGFLVGGAVYPGKTSDTNFTYLAALSYKFMPSLNTYARIASSYRPGGPELAPAPGYATFKPDSLVNYEIGVKGDWLEKRLRSTLAVYYMDWKDVQMSFLDVSNAVLTNGGRASSKGVEFEGDYAPVRDLTFHVALAYTDAVLESVDTGVTQQTGAVAGNSLPYTPKWSGSAGADYEHSLVGKLRYNLGATYRYQGSKWSDYPGDPYNTGVIIPAYHTLDLRAGLKWEHYTAQVRLTNVFNDRGLDTVVQNRVTPGEVPAWAAVIQPRTVILSLSATF